MANIRLAQPKDAQEIAQVYVETSRNTYAGLLPDSILERMSFKCQRASLSHTLASRHQVVVLEYDGDVVGFGSCDYNKLQRFDYSGEIYTLYLLPNFHGCGFGRQLIRALFDVLIGRNYDSALLWVLAENPARFFTRRWADVALTSGTREFGGINCTKLPMVGESLGRFRRQNYRPILLQSRGMYLTL